MTHENIQASVKTIKTPWAAGADIAPSAWHMMRFERSTDPEIQVTRRDRVNTDLELGTTTASSISNANQIGENKLAQKAWGGSYKSEVNLDPRALTPTKDKRPIMKTVFQQVQYEMINGIETDKFNDLIIDGEIVKPSPQE